ncbi:MAG: DsbA family protein [Hyphomicrobiaceae bacterium]
MTNKMPIAIQLTRRAAVGSALAASIVALSGASAFAQKAGGGKTVPVDALMKPGSLPDIVVGKADAPITIVEYASMTCGHCAHFHNTVFPELKTKYIDIGKVRLIMREFPLDNLAAAASMLTRCAGGDKTQSLIKKFFADQESWAFVRGNPLPALLKVAESEGMTKEQFDKCLTDQKLLDGLTEGRDKASKEFGVNSTPTFFINGHRMEERSDQIAGFDKALEPLLKK